RYSDAKESAHNGVGDRTWALVRSGPLGARRCDLLEIREQWQSNGLAGSSGYRIAHGEIELDAPQPGRGLALLALSLHESLAEEGVEAGSEFAPLDPALAASPPNLATPAFDAWLAGLLRARALNVRRARRRAEWLDPAQRSV